MASLTTNVPRHAWHRFAKWIKISHNASRSLDQVPKDISDHLARDVGLSAHDLELLRHEWPSVQHRRGV